MSTMINIDITLKGIEIETWDSSEVNNCSRQLRAIKIQSFVLFCICFDVVAIATT